MNLTVTPEIKISAYQFDSLNAFSAIEGYIKPKLHNTVMVCSISDYHNNVELDDYYTVKRYEKKHNISSKQMFESWLDGKVYGTDYTEWVTSYMSIKDKIYAGND